MKKIVFPLELLLKCKPTVFPIQSKEHSSGAQGQFLVCECNAFWGSISVYFAKAHEFPVPVPTLHSPTPWLFAFLIVFFPELVFVTWKESSQRDVPASVLTVCLYFYSRMFFS
jgi:hypothetical protein